MPELFFSVGLGIVTDSAVRDGSLEGCAQLLCWLWLALCSVAQKGPYIGGAGKLRMSRTHNARPCLGDPPLVSASSEWSSSELFQVCVALTWNLKLDARKGCPGLKGDRGMEDGDRIRLRFAF